MVTKRSLSRSSDTTAPKKAKEQLEAREALDKSQAGTSATQRNNKGNTMSDSIIEYAEDITNAEPPVPLPAQDYPAEIRGAEKKQGPKAEYINVTFSISPDDYPADYTEGNPDGTLLSYMRLNPGQDQRARYNMRKFCEAIGAPTGSKIDLNDWIGKQAIITVANEPYDGVMQASIKKVNPV